MTWCTEFWCGTESSVHRTKWNVTLTLYLLMWRIWWASNNASKGQMGFNLAFKELMNSMEQSLCLEVCGCSASEEILILSLMYSQRLYHKTTSWATQIHSKRTQYVTSQSENTFWLPSFQSGSLTVKNHKKN